MVNYFDPPRYCTDDIHTEQLLLYILFNKKTPSPLIFEKMTKFQKGLEWPHFASRSSGTSHSTGFFPVLNLKTGKKSFRNFKPIESWLFSKSKKNFPVFDFEKSQDSMGLKFRNDFFSIFKLSAIKKPIECDVSELLEAKCGFSRNFWSMLIFL